MAKKTKRNRALEEISRSFVNRDEARDETRRRRKEEKAFQKKNQELRKLNRKFKT